MSGPMEEVAAQHAELTGLICKLSGFEMDHARIMVWVKREIRAKRAGPSRDAQMISHLNRKLDEERRGHILTVARAEAALDNANAEREAEIQRARVDARAFAKTSVTAMRTQLDRAVALAERATAETSRARGIAERWANESETLRTELLAREQDILAADAKALRYRSRCPVTAEDVKRLDPLDDEEVGALAPRWAAYISKLDGAWERERYVWRHTVNGTAYSLMEGTSYEALATSAGWVAEFTGRPAFDILDEMAAMDTGAAEGHGVVVRKMLVKVVTRFGDDEVDQ